MRKGTLLPSPAPVDLERRPARLSWSVPVGGQVNATLHCGRDLTGLSAILEVYVGGTGRRPVEVRCAVSDEPAGIVSVQFEASGIQSGTWLWNLVITSTPRSYVAYTGTIAIGAQ